MWTEWPCMFVPFSSTRKIGHLRVTCMKGLTGKRAFVLSNNSNWATKSKVQSPPNKTGTIVRLVTVIAAPSKTHSMCSQKKTLKRNENRASKTTKTKQKPCGTTLFRYFKSPNKLRNQSIAWKSYVTFINICLCPSGSISEENPNDIHGILPLPQHRCGRTTTSPINRFHINCLSWFFCRSMNSRACENHWKTTKNWSC